MSLGRGGESKRLSLKNVHVFLNYEISAGTAQSF